MAFEPSARDLNRLTSEVFGSARAPQTMAMDAYVRAQRPESPGGDGEVSYLTAERPRGTFSRQLSLGAGLDVDNIQADYTDGVLTVTLPVAERAKPRRIEVGRGSGREVIEGSS